MPRKKLHETLTDLHRQLEEGALIDASDREYLVEVLGDIQRVLDVPDEGEAGARSADGDSGRVGTRVNEAVVRFETSHPTIAAGLSEVVELLKRL